MTVTEHPLMPACNRQWHEVEWRWGRDKIRRMRLCGHGLCHTTPQRVQKPPRKYTHSVKKENVTQEMI